MDISAYQDYINKPWGRLFYRLVWHRLPFSGKNILDFGSGLGVTADHLAQCNAVFFCDLHDFCAQLLGIYV